MTKVYHNYNRISRRYSRLKEFLLFFLLSFRVILKLGDKYGLYFL